MATSITFPAPVTLSSRRHRVTSDVTKAARADALRRHPSSRTPEVRGEMVISCSDCTRQNSSACDDCVVTFVCGSLVAMAPEEADALALFQLVGLLPALQHAEARHVYEHAVAAW